MLFFCFKRRGDELHLHFQFGMFQFRVRVASEGGIPEQKIWIFLVLTVAGRRRIKIFLASPYVLLAFMGDPVNLLNWFIWTNDL